MSDPAGRDTTGSHQLANPARGGNGRGKANVEAEDETVQEAVLRYEDFRIRPHGCFACGELNEAGLHLKLHLTFGRCRTELEIPRRFEGWEGIIHGGILCTILDEVMAWALVACDNWGVTARMSVDFKRPVVVGQRIRAEGWLTESRRRIQTTAARLVDADTGVELATAQATYVAATDARKRELKELYGVAEAQHRTESERLEQTAPDGRGESERPEEAAQ
jgi:acyl-coenzyme A thioesterase PaaI-like protein